MKNIFVIGATSAIAEATIRLYAEQNARFCLLARNQDRLQTIVADLTIRGANEIFTDSLDLEQFDSHKALIDKGFQQLGPVDIVLIAHGSLPDQKLCEQDFSYALTELNINMMSTISLLTHIANKMKAQGKGSIVVITSAAGDRGKQSNYLYGAAKAMLSVFLQGLAHRLYKKKLQVIDIKLGFVDTPMTKQFTKGILWVQPETIAKGIVKAVESGKSTVYLPWFWRYLMLIIRCTPNKLFNRLKL